MGGLNKWAPMNDKREDRKTARKDIFSAKKASNI